MTYKMCYMIRRFISISYDSPKKSTSSYILEWREYLGIGIAECDGEWDEWITHDVFSCWARSKM